MPIFLTMRGWINNDDFIVLVNFSFKNIVEKHCLHHSNFKPLVHHRTALLKMHQYGHAGMLHHLTLSHMDQSEGSKLTWRILVQVSLRNSLSESPYSPMCSTYLNIPRFRSAPCGNLCIGWSAVHPDCHHRSFWETLAPEQELVSDPRGPAHSLQHPPYLRGGQLTWDLIYTVLCEICSFWKFCLLTDFIVVVLFVFYCEINKNDFWFPNSLT